jgi:hypothetical protein
MLFNIFKKDNISLCGFKRKIKIYKYCPNKEASKISNEDKLYSKMYFKKEGLLFFSKNKTIDFSVIDFHDSDSYEHTVESKKDRVIREMESFEVESLLTGNGDGEFIIELIDYIFKLNDTKIKVDKFDQYEMCVKTEDLSTITDELHSEKLISQFGFNKDGVFVSIDFEKISMKETKKQIILVSYIDDIFNVSNIT